MSLHPEQGLYHHQHTHRHEEKGIICKKTIKDGAIIISACVMAISSLMYLVAQEDASLKKCSTCTLGVFAFSAVVFQCLNFHYFIRCDVSAVAVAICGIFFHQQPRSFLSDIMRVLPILVVQAYFVMLVVSGTHGMLPRKGAGLEVQSPDTRLFQEDPSIVFGMMGPSSHYSGGSSSRDSIFLEDPPLFRVQSERDWATEYILQAKNHFAAATYGIGSWEDNAWSEIDSVGSNKARCASCVEGQVIAATSQPLPWRPSPRRQDSCRHW